jgi:hypothetical protein
MRIRRFLVAGAVTLVSVSWGVSASAAPQHDATHDRAPVHRPIVIAHTMSSCGNMDGF